MYKIKKFCKIKNKNVHQPVLYCSKTFNKFVRDVVMNFLTQPLQIVYVILFGILFILVERICKNQDFLDNVSDRIRIGSDTDTKHLRISDKNSSASFSKFSKKYDTISENSKFRKRR